MKIKINIYLILSFLIFSCNNKQLEKTEEENNKPEILNGGQLIRFHKLPTEFETTILNKDSLHGKIEAPALVAANILKPTTAEADVIILFDDPELTNLYSNYLQSLAHYKRDKITLERVKDLYNHQAATGRELIEAETGLSEAATELEEVEGRLKMEGFEPEELKNAKPGMVWLISDVPESALNAIQTGKECMVEFTSFPGEKYKGKVAAIGEVIDRSTRTVNVRISLPNQEKKFRPGMYAKVSFGLKESNILSVPQSSLVSVQGKDFVFKKSTNDYIRTEVILGKQIGNSVEIMDGVNKGDTIVSEGTLLLKGLSFGY